MLGPMQDNGGETDTMAVRYGSLALDRGHGFGHVYDQRRPTNFTPIAILNIGGSGPVTNTHVDVGAAVTYSNRYYRVRLVQ
jgi:hypothetical protein